jgi:hypothetical protein
VTGVDPRRRASHLIGSGGRQRLVDMTRPGLGSGSPCSARFIASLYRRTAPASVVVPARARPHRRPTVCVSSAASSPLGISISTISCHSRITSEGILERSVTGRVCKCSARRVTRRKRTATARTDCARWTATSSRMAICLVTRRSTRRTCWPTAGCARRSVHDHTSSPGRRARIAPAGCSSPRTSRAGWSQPTIARSSRNVTLASTDAGRAHVRRRLGLAETLKSECL